MADDESGPPAPRRRADARRNQASLLDAAAAAFVESGVDAPVRDIATRAGVGVGTIYRHFPTRADLIVAVGTHATLVEFLDKGRQGMASTFLTRLRVGGKLVDAKGVSRLYRTQISVWSLVALVLATLIAMAAAVFISSAGQAYGDLMADAWADFLFWVRELV